MDAVVFLLGVALVSLLITRIATVALVVTGVPRPIARFQARSALSGVGYTTSESESLVNHPIRRRILMALMLLGNVGLATAVAGLLGGFARADAQEGATRALLLLGGIAGVYWLSRSPVVDRALSRAIERVLARFTDLELADVDRLLHLSGPYSVKELAIEPGTWLAGRSLGERRLRDEGVVVLGVTRRDGSYLGIPGRDTVVEGGDTVIVYGRDEVVAALARRPADEAGDVAHAEAVAAHRRTSYVERVADDASDAAAARRAPAG